jgi:hypothetical protein
MGEHFSAAQRPQCGIPEQRRRIKVWNLPPHLCVFLLTNMDVGARLR